MKGAMKGALAPAVKRAAICIDPAWWWGTSLPHSLVDRERIDLNDAASAINRLDAVTSKKPPALKSS
jgi:hypothetical protein